jgi:hypothetical protein
MQFEVDYQENGTTGFGNRTSRLADKETQHYKNSA